MNPEPPRPATGLSGAAAGMLLLVAFVAAFGVYANHFENGFRVEDRSAIVDNPALRSLADWRSFYAEGSESFSVAPAERRYRPLVTHSLACDYAAAGGLDPRRFHATVFAVFLLEACLLYGLARRAYALSAPDGDARMFAAAVTALRLLHAALPETLNDHGARGEVFASAAVVAGLWIYAAFPRLRSLHLGAVVAAAGLLAHESAAVYPAILAAWALCVERRSLGAAVLAFLPAAAICGGVFWRTRGLSGPATEWGEVDRATYLLTQAWVVPQYLLFFLRPADAAIDHDQEFLTRWTDPRVVVGGAVLAALLVVAVVACRRPRGRLFCFGLAWAVFGFAPSSSVVPLFDARDDRRAYFPFVGLTIALLAALSAAADRVLRWSRAAGEERNARRALIVGFLVVLGAHGVAVVGRNRVWSSEAALWEEAASRAPGNGRAAMNAGTARMRRAEFDAALAHFLRARALTPRSALVEVNLGILKDELGDATAAEEHFRLAAEYAPRDARVPLWKGRRLLKRGDAFGAAAQFGLAVRLAPQDLAARRELLAALEAAELPSQLTTAAAEARAAFPQDPVIAAALDRLPPGVRAAAEKAARSTPPSAPAYAELSAACYAADRYGAAVLAARTAVELDPTSVDGWNNLGAAYGGLGRYADAIAACREALRLDPRHRFAQANLAWAEGRLAAASRPGAPAGSSAAATRATR